MMNNANTYQLEPQGKMPPKGRSLDPGEILSLIIKNWYYFILALVAVIIGARLYIGHTMPVYRGTTTILIKETEANPVGNNNDELLRGLGLPGGMRNLENQINILKSRELTERTLKELPFEIEYYYKTVNNEIPIYPETPIRIVADKELPLPDDTEFSITYMGNNKFSLESESDNFVFHKLASFGENMEIPGGSIRIECRDEEWFKLNKDQKLYFEIYSRVALINYFNNRLDVELESRTGSILRISIEGTNRAKDVDFLNKLAEIYQSISLGKKNTEAARRIQFIDDQLVGVSDSLSITENKLQKFRSTNRVMDLSAQGQAIITQVTLLENERARLNLEANYYDYLADYLAKDLSKEVPIVPISMGITDPGLTSLVTDLAELQGQLLSRGAGEKNPLQSILVQKVQNTKDALLETLNGLRRANSLAVSENQEQTNRINTQASALPVTERKLLGIERTYKINDEMYTFLLETRAEQQMQKASNVADCEVIEPADELFSIIVAPNPVKIYFIGLFAGFGIPFIIIFLNFLFNKKLKEEDVRKIANIPIVGNIPHSVTKRNTVVLDYPKSSIAEAYRLLLSRMQFITKETISPVILVTSSMPEDGKTFTAINLASVYSLFGKKTILVGFDLRKPKIYQDFNLDNEKGVSTWLIGKDKLQDIIRETSFKNLSVIPSGPIPPNPSELTALEKTDELLKLLKERYDYIILDSTPIGLISDAYHLASLADACILVVRPGKTIWDMLEKTIFEINASGTKGVSLLINDIQSDNKHYDYAEKYGYTNDKQRHKIHLFKRKKAKQQ